MKWYTFRKQANKRGWRFIDGNLYCPACTAGYVDKFPDAPLTKIPRRSKCIQRTSDGYFFVECSQHDCVTTLRRRAVQKGGAR